MVYDVKLSNQSKKYLKKLKDQKLQRLFVDKIYQEISQNPYLAGSQKRGDLSHIFVASLRYQKTDYRLAYEIDEDEILILFKNQIQTTSASPCRTPVLSAARFLVCSLIFIEYYSHTSLRKSREFLRAAKEIFEIV